MSKVTLLERPSGTFWIAISLALIALLDVADYLTGHSIAFSLFYLIPVSLVAWFVGKWSGIIIAVLSSSTWPIIGFFRGATYQTAGEYYWEILTRLGFFLVISLLLSALRKSLQYEKEIARTDIITGSPNALSFYEILETEISRSTRYKRPFTVAYIDLDNFKALNDRFGHYTGNEALRMVVTCVKCMLRDSDAAARLGGDEFAILMPETGLDTAKTVVARIQSSLLNTMQKNAWPVTFSIGVLTCIDTSLSVDGIIKEADDLMYAVKNNGKNAVTYSIRKG